VLPGRESAEQFAKKFHKKISSVYSEEELNTLGKEVGFIKRQSKLTPLMFVDTVLFKDASNAVISLQDHCVGLKHRYGLSIKKQSLDERFDASAVDFIQELLKRHLANQITSVLDKGKLCESLRHFSSIKIKDSTRFQVPGCLSKHYPGSAGGASGAGIHIQYEFDILKGKVNDLHVTHALKQDTTDAQETMSSIEKGSLIIRDLGYFSSRVLDHVETQKAYYITRPKAGITLCSQRTGKKIEFEKIYQKMRRQKLSSMELPVYASKNNLATRLIIEMIPDKEVQKRLRIAQKASKKQGWTMSNEFKSRMRLNLFMTNIPSAWVATQEVRRIYQLRWQIELRFKAWKSFYGLDAIKKMHLHRFECYLYATLLLLMIHIEIGNQFFCILWKHTEKPLSFLKFLKTTSQGNMTLREGLLKQTEKIISYVKLLYEASYENFLTEKRHHHSPLENILRPSID